MMAEDSIETVAERLSRVTVHERKPLEQALAVAIGYGLPLDRAERLVREGGLGALHAATAVIRHPLPTFRPCPDCGGTGAVRGRTDFPGQPIRRNCPRCDGAGVIAAPDPDSTRPARSPLETPEAEAAMLDVGPWKGARDARTPREHVRETLRAALAAQDRDRLTVDIARQLGARHGDVGSDATTHDVRRVIDALLGPEPCRGSAGGDG